MKKAAVIIGSAFILFGILVPLLVTAVTFILPPTYASAARIAYTATTPPLETAVGKIMSRSSLGQVTTNLNLTAEWARKYKQPGELSLDQCRALLIKMLQISAPAGSAWLEIKIFSDDRNEAAAIANEVAGVYLRNTPGAVFSDRAAPGPQPVRPNKRLNILLGTFAGLTLLIVGVGLLVASRFIAGRKP